MDKLIEFVVVVWFVLPSIRSQWPSLRIMMNKQSLLRSVSLYLCLSPLSQYIRVKPPNWHLPCDLFRIYITGTNPQFTLNTTPAPSKYSTFHCYLYIHILLMPNLYTCLPLSILLSRHSLYSQYPEVVLMSLNYITDCNSRVMTMTYRKSTIT